MNYLPWQAKIWQQLQERRDADRLPHALLLSGPAGTGKQQFAQAFAESLLCKAPDDDGSACGHCKACELIAAGSHPDWTVISPEEEGKAIKVDQIRSLSEFTSLHAHYEGFKVVIVQPAEQMNRAAANSLLKTLEEPSDNTVLILVSANPHRLLPTIRSRCQLLPFASPSRTDALAWLSPQLQQNQDAVKLLEIAAGAPLTALKLADSALMDVFEDNFTSIEAILSRQQDPLQV